MSNSTSDINEDRAFELEDESEEITQNVEQETKKWKI